jgi:DNA-binding transcriptional regulator YdaS (Cro superfamily)
MKTRSVDLREQVGRARDVGMPRTEVARLFGVSERSVSQWFEIHLTTGRIARPGPPRSPCPQACDPTYFNSSVSLRPDAEWRKSAVTSISAHRQAT